MILIFHRDLINEEIKADRENPKEPNHLEYQYLKSKAGPLFINNDDL